MDVFDLFKSIKYDYLEIGRGTVYGNRIKSETTNLDGIFKLRANQESLQNMETETSSATLHVKPGDYSIPTPELIGNGVRVGGIYYQIIRATEGVNFDTGVVEHITLTLERAAFYV